MKEGKNEPVVEKPFPNCRNCGSQDRLFAGLCEVCLQIRLRADTLAQRSLCATRKSLADAMGELAEVVIGEISGHEEYSVEYIGKLRQALRMLVDVKKLIG